jgi:hypothetical protein
MGSPKAFDMTRRQFVTSSAATLAAGSWMREARAANLADQAPSKQLGDRPSRVIIDTDRLRSPEMCRWI